MTTTCEAAQYIVDNAEGGRTNLLVCRRVLRSAWVLTKHFRNQQWLNTTGDFLYLEYEEGDEENPNRTRWLINWLFEQAEFPASLPDRWEANPIIETELNIPDAMIGLQRAAKDFIEKNCVEEVDA